MYFIHSLPGIKAPGVRVAAGVQPTCELSDEASACHLPNRFQLSGSHSEQMAMKMDGGVVVAWDQFDLVAGAQLTAVAVG